VRANRPRRTRKAFAAKPSGWLSPELPAYVGFDPKTGRYRDPYRDWKEAQRNKHAA
jgi:hypothetical protein